MTSCPCLLQSEQPPFPQHPLLTGFVPQLPDQLCGLPLNLLQFLDVFLSLPNTGQSLPQSIMCVCSHTGQDAAGLLCCKGTLLAPYNLPNVLTKMFVFKS